jgi:hypothetical protein
MHLKGCIHKEHLFRDHISFTTVHLGSIHIT